MSFRRAQTVNDHWRAELPEERQRVFDDLRTQWEEFYAMLSVALNDAIALRSSGTLVRAREQAAFAAQLAVRLSDALLPTIAALKQRGRTGDLLPPVEPLRYDHFRGETAREAASWNLVLHWLVPGRRSRFAVKTRKLEETVAQVTRQFHEAATEIADGICVEPEAGWKTLEILHYDLNTSMRETLVVLKSYLLAASGEGFAAFRGRVHSPVAQPSSVSS
jgi:hypothetical protein